MTARGIATAARGVAPATIGAALAATCLGLLWLAVSARLTAVGARIDRLEAQRSNLLEQRAEAILAYAGATDPRALEARARALGLGPSGAGRALHLAPGARTAFEGRSALAILLAQREGNRADPVAMAGAPGLGASRSMPPTGVPPPADAGSPR